MTNSLAIATVTSTIRHLLEQSLNGSEPGAVSGAGVTTIRPDQLLGAPPTKPRAGLNVHLYHLTWNHVHHARVGLDLHYLVTAYGDEVALEPQRLLGRAARALASTPVLTAPVIAAAVAEHGTGDTAFLAASDLGATPDPVRLTPTPLSIDEAAQLWRALDTPLLPSLAYTANVVSL